jgi:uncharacterized membrane protein YeaQ/YmgE (transglycosylase-associated protein family)
MTVIVGAVIGISWRRFSATHMFGGITDMLLGITGAFAARCLLDVFSLFGVASSSYDIVFILWGAGLLPWCFHRFLEIRSHSADSRPKKISQSAVVPSDKADSSETRAPANYYSGGAGASRRPESLPNLVV